MSATYIRKDSMRTAVNAILTSTIPYAAKMFALTAIEPMIEQQWKAGKTNIKPVSEMTADDLWI